MTDHTTVLKKAGVHMPDPSQVTIADTVNLSRIAAGTTLHPGVRLSGRDTTIGPNSDIGAHGPVVLNDCQLGAGVSIGSGSLSHCTLLNGTEVGPGAYFRAGCLLEEQASCAHNVGLKQTVLMPYVILGSLINFCDCLMAGGTSRTHHSEVGSSYVHFNYTPHRDKATASLLGDVPHGVMMDQSPIFLGGQGGLVGPVRITYGTVLAAGTIQRRDVLEPGLLITGSAASKARPRRYQPGLYGDISRVLQNNGIYLGNLHALREWYRHVRPLFLKTPTDTHCHEGALLRLNELIDERIKQLDRLAQRVTASLDRARSDQKIDPLSPPFTLHRRFVDQWASRLPHINETATPTGEEDARTAFLETLDTASPYLEAVQQLSTSARTTGARWLQSIVDRIAASFVF